MFDTVQAKILYDNTVIYREHSVFIQIIFFPLLVIIDGEWGEWSAFEEISRVPVTCGANTYANTYFQRTRVCDSPIPIGGGILCPLSTSGNALCENERELRFVISGKSRKYYLTSPVERAVLV